MKKKQKSSGPSAVFSNKRTIRIQPPTLEDVESLLADRLSIIDEGKGHWAECIQAIEKFGKAKVDAERNRVCGLLNEGTLKSCVDRDGSWTAIMKDALVKIAAPPSEVKS